MHSLPYRLGFKLALGWRGDCEDGRLPRVADLYGLLAGAGFDYFEFGVGTGLDPQEGRILAAEVDACRAAGLAVALHPYLGSGAGPACFEEAPEAAQVLDAALTAAEATAAATGQDVPVVFHPAECAYDASEPDVPALRARLLQASQAFVQEADRQSRRRSGVVPVIEHQLPPVPGETVIRIGDTSRELMAVASGTELGLCWDTGHYLLSVERHGQPLRPAGEFVRRVTHVHLHDVVDGIDHCVFTRFSAGPRRLLQLLLDQGFSGRVTLEYSGAAIMATGSFEPVLAASLEALAAQP